jgi:uncharacterized membrane protein YphA (DoxX/SURF4 family)
MSKYSAQTYALLRIVAGFLFLFISAYGPGIWSLDGRKGK